MGVVASNLVGLQHRDMLQGRREAPVSVVAANGGQKAAEFYVERYFGDGKEAAL